MSDQNLTFAGQPTIFNETTYNDPSLCTLATCPKDYAPIQYVPNLGGNAFYLAWFAACGTAQVILSIRFHTWTYLLATLSGCILEILGYAARILMHEDVFNFNWYLICLTIAPVFFTAAIYLTFSRLILLFDPRHARFQPTTYTYLFIACDILALVLQAAGGALADTAANGGTGQIGIDIMIAGLASQVVSLVGFGVLCGDFAWKVKSRRGRGGEGGRVRAREVLRKIGSGGGGGLEGLVVGLVIATTAIFIRSCYRIAELRGGFGGKLANQEVSFVILEGAMVAIATLALTVAHPGFVFKRVWKMGRAKEAMG